MERPSPADPIFWLHHGFIDKLFADWQILNPAAIHPNSSEILKPSPIMTRTNAQVWSTLGLGYIYVGRVLIICKTLKYAAYFRTSNFIIKHSFR
jgi:hypothetical protein